MLYTFGGKAPQVDPTAFVSASAELIGDVIVGPRCYIGPYAVIRADASRIVLEEEVAVEDGVIIHTGGEDPVVTISRRVTIGHGAIIHARVIGPEASIGMGAVLSLCSEIGAGSVVIEEVPPNCTVVGVPGRIVKRDNEKVPRNDMDQVHLPDPIENDIRALQEDNLRMHRQIQEMEKCMQCLKENPIPEEKKEEISENEDI